MIRVCDKKNFIKIDNRSFDIIQMDIHFSTIPSLRIEIISGRPFIGEGQGPLNTANLILPENQDDYDFLYKIFKNDNGGICTVHIFPEQNEFPREARLILLSWDNGMNVIKVGLLFKTEEIK